MQKVTVSFRVWGDPEEAKAAVQNALQLGCVLAENSLTIRAYKIEGTEQIEDQWP